MTGQQDGLLPLRLAAQAPATAEELSGEAAVLAAFRAGAARHRRRGLRVVPGAGLTAAAAVVALSMTGMTAAAYTSALPHEVQRTAHRIFHRIGVPAAREPHRAGARGGEATGWAGRPVVPAAGVVPVGTAVRVGLRWYDDRGPALVVVTLLTRTPGAAAWTAVGRAVLDRTGRASVTLPRVEHSLQLRWSLQEGSTTAVLGPVSELLARPTTATRLSRAGVVVRGAASLSLVTAPAQAGRLAVLERLVQGRWEVVADAPLDVRGRAVFRLDTRRSGSTTYRCVLPSGALFATATGSPVTLTVR
jgi:hypothetical protein